MSYHNVASLEIEKEQSRERERSSEAVITAFPKVVERPYVSGKFLFAGSSKLYIKGVTYGTFGPNEDGDEFHQPDQVRADFAAMARHGINTVRTYTVPPVWLLDLAQQFGLRVMVGLPWEQHITFLDDAATVRSIEQRIQAYVGRCTGHPALLCYSIGNEIPASIIRWYGRQRIEQFLHRLYRLVKAQDPTALVTYVNFPTTEYLELPFLDLVCFNVYLESRQTLKDYLARLQNLAGDRPLMMAEIGLDSQRNGEQAQAETLAWQIQATFEEGCCGAFVFAWTDEWYRGGAEIEDWDFGLVRRDRSAKPALKAVRTAFNAAPFAADREWPRVSVVVCSLNGAATIRDTMEALQRVEYPDYEVIVIDDGSTDRTAEIAAEYPVHLVSTENRGLSAARNLGLHIASGEIVAYIDDDAYPDPHWLHYLATMFAEGGYVGVGGPNLPPAGDGWIADCVANSPGGPMHVLLTDRIAEHIPGCNMAFRRNALLAIGGFDTRYRAAGDDVDVCWRLQDNGGELGFTPGAVVWHHRRNSVRTYWRQQKGYGKAEAMLEEKWPQKYNSLGHTTWGGRIYGKGSTLHLGGWRSHVYQGVWGSAAFQSLYQPAPSGLASLPLMPEWYLLTAALGFLSLLGAVWAPLLAALPVLVLALLLPVVQAVMSAARAHFISGPQTRLQRWRLYGVTAFMHLQQPLARLIGRLRHGLTPWRGGNTAGWFTHLRFRPFALSVWREQWQDPHEALHRLQQDLLKRGIVTVSGGEYDRHDLEARGGLLGRARVLLAVEEHGAGRQMLRFRLWPKWTRPGLVMVLLLGALTAAALADGAWAAGLVLGALALAVCVRGLYESVIALDGVIRTIAGRQKAEAKQQTDVAEVVEEDWEAERATGTGTANAV